MDARGGVQQSSFEVPAGNSEFYVYFYKYYNLTFQAGLINIAVGFEEEDPDDKPEPLEMEHFYFPLGLWLAGLIISLIFLLAEIVLNRKKQRGNVPMATQE